MTATLVSSTPVTSPLLDELLTRLPGARQVVVGTDAGLVHALPSNGDRQVADQLCALGANLISLSGGLSHLGYGKPRRFLTRVPAGWLLVFPIDERLRAVLVVEGTVQLKRARTQLDALITRFLDLYGGAR